MSHPTAPTPQQFSWSAHPALERPLAAAGALGVIVGLAAIIFLESGSPWWAFGAAIVLVMALNRFFFASRYEVDDRAIVARHPLRTQTLHWSAVRRFVHDSRGGYLSTRAEPSRLDAYRGMHILFGRRREAVLNAINDRLVLTGGALA